MNLEPDDDDSLRVLDQFAALSDDDDEEDDGEENDFCVRVDALTLTLTGEQLTEKAKERENRLIQHEILKNEQGTYNPISVCPVNLPFVDPVNARALLHAAIPYLSSRKSPVHRAADFRQPILLSTKIRVDPWFDLTSLKRLPLPPDPAATAGWPEYAKIYEAVTREYFLPNSPIVTSLGLDSYDQEVLRDSADLQLSLVVYKTLIRIVKDIKKRILETPNITERGMKEIFTEFDRLLRWDNDGTGERMLIMNQLQKPATENLRKLLSLRPVEDKENLSPTRMSVRSVFLVPRDASLLLLEILMGRFLVESPESQEFRTGMKGMLYCVEDKKWRERIDSLRVAGARWIFWNKLYLLARYAVISDTPQPTWNQTIFAYHTGEIVTRLIGMSNMYKLVAVSLQSELPISHWTLTEWFLRRRDWKKVGRPASPSYEVGRASFCYERVLDAMRHLENNFEQPFVEPYSLFLFHYRTPLPRAGIPEELTTRVGRDGETIELDNNGRPFVLQRVHGVAFIPLAGLKGRNFRNFMTLPTAEQLQLLRNSILLENVEDFFFDRGNPRLLPGAPRVWIAGNNVGRLKVLYRELVGWDAQRLEKIRRIPASTTQGRREQTIKLFGKTVEETRRERAILKLRAAQTPQGMVRWEEYIRAELEKKHEKERRQEERRERVVWRI